MSYPLLADEVSNHTSLQIFKHFSDLNAKSLLYYQAELAQLSDELKEVEQADATCKLEPRCKYAKTFWRLRDSVNEYGSVDQAQNSSDGQSGLPSDRNTNRNSSVDGNTGTTTTGDGAASRQWKLICEIRGLLEEYCAFSPRLALRHPS